MILRKERASDIEAIGDVPKAAFSTVAISKQAEQYIIKTLRAAGALSISLVAEIDAKVVGHAAFSPATISDGSTGWYDLGSVSVLPEHQRQGIGKSLTNKGLTRLKGLGAQGCALVGDPNYYKQLGFRNYPGLVYKGVPQEVFVALPFFEKVPQGTAVFHDAFSATS